MPTTILPTYDPTDKGNKPGDGPLRPGGVPGGEVSAPAPETSRPSTPNAATKRQAPALEMVRDLWNGNEAVKDATTKYLPCAPGEEMVDYRMRLGRSMFHNYFRRTIDGLVGLIFRKDPNLSDDVPPEFLTHWENIDNAGTHGDVLCREVATDAMTAGHTLLLVEFPNTGGERLTRAAERNLRPYWVPVKKDNIVSWRSATVDGRQILTQLVLRETVTVPMGAFGEKTETRYRVLYHDIKTGRVGWALLYETDQKQVIVLEEGTYPTQNEIPVVEIVTTGRRGLLDSDPPLLDLAYLNIAHYQQWSDYATSIHLTCVPIFFGTGMESDGDMVLGGNTMIMTPNTDATAAYVSHDGSSLGAAKDALDDLKADIGAMGIAMLSPQKRTAETAEAHRLDKSTGDSALAVVARAVQDGIERAMGFHARYMGLSDGGSITINRDFEGLLMDAPIMSAYVQLVQAGFPGRIVLKALQAGGRISEDEDLEALEMEWLAGGEAARELAIEQAPAA